MANPARDAQGDAMMIDEEDRRELQRIATTLSRHQRVAAQVVMAVCGLSHTFNTKVGNDFVRGVSGGERKRVSIAEMMLSGSSICAWDNSTRGLDSATTVEDVIDMLNMRDFVDAIVGISGEGLNVEQRKLLTIGVELAAKPKLLLFLDEPTSCLDSQSSWAICAFLRKLAGSGQTVLCTAHQPSAILLQQFDRLLFLARGGKTVYFGYIGEDSRTLLNYFESHGVRRCGHEEDPAEYMLEIVNDGPNSKGEDWHTVWKSSNQRHGFEAEIERSYLEKEHEEVAGSDDAGARSDFAMPFTVQLMKVTTRIFQQYWRTPSYIFAKCFLGIAAGLFIGFSFWEAGGTLAEVCERPSKVYSWKTFMFASIMVEIPYQIITGILIWACFYYPVVGVQTPVRQVLVLLYSVQLLIYASSFAHMTIAALPDAQTASGLVTLLVLMSLTFCGALQPPSALPGFWIFKYRVTPFTYWVAGIKKFYNCQLGGVGDGEELLLSEQTTMQEAFDEAAPELTEENTCTVKKLIR
ncbi:ABC-2 type transporter-domain-containing protein [Colletotrichum navitas]|uniref:ABC-2 type transporter-domain-containing protein n=1 Tax=Colletotrichum navitas TaxID=681940 RepID=A0AAD8PX40_9PEZI|nr:ABC-2 type transporter-domain-containing protein [Colletotrichum navitas]KAK1585778.1 ABC-2 type transporter-domain-containing protein [Colletotrichum navitas]